MDLETAKKWLETKLTLLKLNLKIIAEESLEEINEWNIEINAKLAQADKDVKRMKEWLESRQCE